MPYLSQILNNKISDSADSFVGRLKDVVIVPREGEYDPLLFLLVKGGGPTFAKASAGKKEIFIPYEYVENIGRDEIDLKSPLSAIVPAKPTGDYIGLARDVLDQQIVDVGGARVVRVNDLRIGLFENKMCVLGIDISFKGILRRLGIAGLDLFDWFKVNLIDWRKTQPVKGILKLDTVSKNLIRLHPADLANIIEDLNIKHGSQLVGSLDSTAAAAVVEEMDPAMQKTIIHYLGPEKAGDIVERMSIDEAVDLLKMLSRDEAKKFLAYLKDSKLKKVEKLISYADDTAGGLMTTEYVAGRKDWSVGRAVEEIKKSSPALRSVVYVFLTDEDGNFQGSVSLRRLLLAGSDELVEDVMKDMPASATLFPEQDIDEVIRVMTKYDLYAAAVVEKNNKLVGIVTIDDVMRHLVPNA